MALAFNGFWNSDDSDVSESDGYKTVVVEPSLAGKFAEVGIPDRTSAQNIYASPDTQDKLAKISPELMAAAAEVSGADNVIFVSKDDIKPEIQKFDELDGMKGDVLHGADYAHYGDAFNGFREKFSDAPALIDPGAAEDAYNQNASAFLYEHENGQTYCTIALPDMDKTAEDGFKSFSGIKNITKLDNGDLSFTQVNISKSEALNNASTSFDILHEAGHCANSHSNKGASEAKILHQEQEADNVGVHVTNHLFPDVGEEAVQIKQDARAVGAMNLLDSPDHNTNADLHGDSNISPQQQLDSLAVINNEIVTQAAKDIDSSPEEAKEMLDGDPQFKHATLDKVNQLGAFKDNPAAQEYVDDYMEAGERRIPEYLGIEPDKTAPEANANTSHIPETTTQAPQQLGM